ncbi:MAG: AraC family transcriptional regulator, partial [Phycisphaeraceae bacterium]|nr:AraC family transcriptional regulator [Phycisphaeraceae bacterium]
HVCAHFAFPPTMEQEKEGVVFPAHWSVGEAFDARYRELEELIERRDATSACQSAVVWAWLWRLRPAVKADEGVRPHHPAVREAAALMERRLAHLPKIGDIADEVGVSHNHLTRLFKRELGQAPAAYLRDRRVGRARYLLTESTMPLQSIAREVGAADAQAFNKLVRYAIGKSPRALRRGQTGDQS